MARVSGTNLRIYDGTTPIGYATNCSLSITMATTEVLHKDSTGNFADNDASTQSWTMTTDGFISEDDTINGNAVKDVSYLRSAIINRTRLYLQWSDNTSGSQTMEGFAYCTQLDENAPVNETATYTASFTGDGAISLGTET